MAGLVGYASSDDEEDGLEHRAQKGQPKEATATPADDDEADNGAEVQQAESLKQAAWTQQDDPKQAEPAVLIGPVPQSAVPLGPSLPPMEASMTTTDADEEATQAPSSPYSANRAIIHDLTLPSVPNLDIPPSPPGSPSPGVSKKFEQFLELKKKGTHFNSKLEQSAALKNPALMDKLLAYVEMDEANQYETTLPADLWDPKAFPEWAFRDRLKKSRDKLAKEREADRATGGRSAVDFVPSVNATAGSAAGTGGLVSRGEKRRGGWK